MLNNMNKKQITCLAALTLGLYAAPSWAEQYSWPGFSRPAHAQRHAQAGKPYVSPDEAAARVQRQHGGRILAVETLQRNGQTFYRIKLLTRKGVVRVIRVNAGNRR